NDTTHQQTSGGVTTDNLMTFDGATLFAIAESPLQAGVIWAGSNDGLVHVTRDGGGQWTDVTGNLPKLPPWGKITNIEPSHLDARALAGRAWLFAPPPAYRFRATQGVASAPNSAVQAQNPPGGAVVTYHLATALADTEARADSAARPDSTHPPARLIVVDARGDTVRVLQGERKPGLNRVWWDLRYAPPAVPKLRTPPPGKP